MKIIKLLQLVMVIVVSANKPRVWYRVNDDVYERTLDFMDENGITNCFEYVEQDNYLRLKCWRDNQLMNVDIRINPSFIRRYHTSKSLSI